MALPTFSIETLKGKITEAERWAGSIPVLEKGSDQHALAVLRWGIVADEAKILIEEAERISPSEVLQAYQKEIEGQWPGSWQRYRDGQERLPRMTGLSMRDVQALRGPNPGSEEG